MKRLSALPPIWTLAYVFIYVPWFSALEGRSPYLCTIVQLPLDRLIPFCEYFIVPYLLWFFYIGAGLLYLLWHLPRQEYYRLAALFFGGLTVCLVLNTVFYTGLHLRVPIDPEKNVFTMLVAKLWAADTSTNVCPSIHVYATLVMSRTLARQQLLRRHLLLRGCNQVLAVAIILSTVLLKQHSVIDVACAFALYALLNAAVYGIEPVPGLRYQRLSV